MRSLKDDTTYNRFNSIKALYYSDRLKEIAEKGITRPVIAHVYPSNRCTHDCDFCIMHDDRQGRELLPDLDGIIKQLKGLGVECVHFSGGGEPMMHAKTPYAIEQAKELGMTTVVSTNGTCGIPEADHIRVSLNAGTKETHAKIMRRNTWDTIINNIRECKFKERVGLGFVFTPDNYMEVYEFCKLAHGLGVNFVHIRPAYIKEDTKPLLKEVLYQSERAKKDFDLNIYSISEKFDGYWTPRKYAKCLATPMNIVIKANGRLIPCQDRLDLEFGDTTKQALSEIWGSDEHLKVLSSINCDDCPRCVMTKINEYIDNIFINNNCIREII